MSNNPFIAVKIIRFFFLPTKPFAPGWLSAVPEPPVIANSIAEGFTVNQLNQTLSVIRTLTEKIPDWKKEKTTEHHTALRHDAHPNLEKCSAST